MRRLLHYVFRVGNRRASYDFFTKTLGMKVLRHEEFETGCEATCNGPYGGSWSKTMVGYGDESDHFVLELTYNYGINSYNMGNDFVGIWIKSSSLFEKLKEASSETVNGYEVKDPDGHSFFLCSNAEQGQSPNNYSDPLYKISFSSSNLDNTIDYYRRLCQMTLVESSDLHCIFAYTSTQCHLEFRAHSGQLNREESAGRIAFSCPTSELEKIETTMRVDRRTIVTPLIKLDTAGKASVQVVILADPDGHEICFVGDEAYRELSKFDPEADRLIREYMDNDPSLK